MKLTGQSVERNGDNVRINATFTNKWRKPINVKIRISDDPGPIMEGDVKETIETLNCIAEIAWNNGWRPSGLPGFLAACIQKFTIPKA